MNKNTTPREAFELMRTDPDARYVDVRMPEEFAAGHPAGAMNIPVFLRGDVGMQQNADFLDVVNAAFTKTQPLLCGCQVGGRSKSAVALLEQAGFSNVSNVLGGFAGGPHPDGSFVSGWRDEGLPVEDDIGADRRDYASLCLEAGIGARR